MNRETLVVRILHWYVVPIMLTFTGCSGLTAGVQLLLAAQSTGSSIDNVVLWASVIVIFAGAVRWSMCSTCFQTDHLMIKKLLKKIIINYSDLNRFEFVTGNVFNYCYIGVIRNDLAVARTSSGPILIYSVIPRGKRLTNWLDSLNSEHAARSNAKPMGLR